jgi:integrase
MAAGGRKRRSPGAGGCWAYQTKAGELFRVKGMVRMPDGALKEVNRRGFPTKTAGLEWLADAQSAGRKGDYIEPSRLALGQYGLEVIEGLRIRPQTRASYGRNWRNHIEPYPLAAVPLAQLTGVRLTAHYRLLEKSGRKDHRAGEGLSPRTTRYIHQIVHGVLGQAVKDGLLLRNPADAATPPTAAEARAPELSCWTAAQLAVFLSWSAEHSQHHALWYVLALTGMRRGELLALRWRDIDLDAGRISIRRSAGMVRVAGEGGQVTEGDTKSGLPRLVDVDAATGAVLRAHRRERGAMALDLVREAALVFGSLEGAHRNPENTTRQFTADVARCRKALGADVLPVIRLHDLRHTHATLLLSAREPVHVVSQRLGHASATVTLSTYAHVMPGSQRDAADLFARLIAGGTS